MTPDPLPVRFAAADGVALQGTFYAASPERATAVAVVFNCGAGIAARHYRRFAAYLAGAGIAVFVYDYRGVGASRPASLRGFAATVEDWAEQDCRAAIDWLALRCPACALVGIGHSFGGILFIGAPNVERLALLVMLGPHTGYYGDYRRVFRLPMALLWHGVMPAITLLCGYFPARLLRLGDDLPKGVAMQWARRRTPLVPIADARTRDRLGELIERGARLTGRALFLTVTDDGFATRDGAARVRGFLPKLDIEHWFIAPADVGTRKLGHFGFFGRASAVTLWPRVTERILAEVRKAEVATELAPGDGDPARWVPRDQPGAVAR